MRGTIQQPVFFALAFALGVSFVALPAEAQRRGKPSKSAWDSRGWVMLGEQKVDGRRDRDVIRVSRRDGKFNKLTMVVLDGDIELQGLTVHFRDGKPFSPRLQHIFREGTRSRLINLPGNARSIERVELRYRNLSRFSRASVQIWGESAARQPPPPPPKRWDSRGWVKLGDATVDGRRDRDVIRVGRREGRFNKLTMAVYDADLELLDFVVHFRDGKPFAPRLKHHFRAGAQTRAIDLPGNARIIDRIEIKYRNLTRGKRASVEIWGQEAKRRR